MQWPVHDRLIVATDPVHTLQVHHARPTTPSHHPSSHWPGAAMSAFGRLSSVSMPSANQSDMTGLKTYIVEDSKVIRESLIATLEELGPIQVVGTAEDEATAVRWVADHANNVDLVIVDLFLKQGSGLGVLRTVHAMAQGCTMVVLSNYATQDIRRKCLDAGADQVFDKSHEIDALIQYCARLAAGETGIRVSGRLQ